jgi:hypothetical protein
MTIILVTEAYLSLRDVQQTIIGDRHPMRITTDVVQHLLGSGERPLSVDHPFDIVRGSRVSLRMCTDPGVIPARRKTPVCRHQRRFINVVDLFRLEPDTEHPHGLSERDFDGLFTKDKPVIFNFHGYPWLIHRLAYRRTNHHNFHVRGYKEKGNINTSLELAILNQTDRFSLAIDVIDRVPKLQSLGAHAKERFRNQQLECRTYAYENGIDKP